MSQAVIFIADGTEECEAITIVDLLRRAGIDLKTVAVKEGGERTILSSHRVLLTCDESIKTYVPDEEEYLIIPGGMAGVSAMKKSEELSQILLQQAKENRGLAAICAGPTVLGGLGLLKGKKSTCYPGCEKDLGKGVKYEREGVISDGKIITGEALGSAIPFALCLIEQMKGKEAAQRIADQIVFRQ